jgi:signal transduction histidine kinase
MFFGGINGFNAFYPAQVTDNPYIPAIVFTDFRIFNESAHPGNRLQITGRQSPLTKPITQTDEIFLSYKDNVFSFEFAALHYSSPSRNQFAYKMEGFDEDWIHSGIRHSATYTNLDPGQYVMRVRGSNNDGIWNNNGAAVKIVIRPPFWQTLWFKISVALCVLLAAFTWYKLRIRHIELQKERLEVLVDEKTREIKETQAQLIQSAKMSVLGKLTASIAHEINNPVGTIMSNADVQIRCLDKLRSVKNLENDPECEKLHRILRSNSEATLSASSRVAKIVKSLKSFTRMGDVASDKMDVNEGLESVLTLLQYELSDSTEIVREYGEIPKIACYPSEINQVFMTLLQNAGQATEEEGRITVSTSSDGENVIVKISDTGTGLPDEKLANLFELNFSAKGSRMGVGLGLPNAHNIIRKHNGTIEVRSTLGEGTEFTITLPVVSETIT